MTGLAGQRVFVTAGATGIGATLVRRFTEAGARVAFCDVDADAVAAQTIGTGHVADVTDEAAMAEVFLMKNRPTLSLSLLLLSLLRGL